jgi:outer membrane protein insertion porin family
MSFTTILRWTLGVLVAGAFSAMCFSAAAPATDNPDTALPAKKVVKSVRVAFSGAATVDEGRIRANMSIREGGAYTEEMSERDVKALYANGVIANIEASDVGGGVNVVVTVSSRGSVGEIDFVGNSVVDSKRLKKEVEIATGDLVDDAKLFAAQTKIRDLYAEKGFADVGISYKVEPMPRSGFSRVVYTITEGQKGLINDIRFEGLTALKDSKVRGKMKLHERRFYNFWSKSTKLNNEALQEDIRTVERLVQDQGYVYAKVVQVRREPVKGDKIDLVFVVDEGRRYNVADVNVEGIKVFTLDELRPGLSLEKGAAYSATSISNDEKMIADYYGSRGYADARVETSVLGAGADSVKILYRVTEGEISHIRKINIEGNQKTKDHVIRRELAFAPGEEFNTVRIEASKKRLENMGYFSNVDFRNNATGTAGFKDIDVTVTETSTGSINLGAGFSSIQSIFGQFQLTQTNFDLLNWPTFTGGGQRFNLDVTYGAKRRDASLNIVEPWFLGQRLSLGGDLFYRDLYYLSDVYDQQNYGFSLNLRKPVGQHSYVDFAYTIQDVKIHNVDAKASDEIKAEEGSFLQSKIDATFAHDTRDDLYGVTRHGHKFEIGAMVSGDFLGGDVGVWGFHVEGQQFFRFPGDLVLALEGSVRTVDTLGSDRVPIFERLFLGGANNLRGFKYREAGPKDSTGEPIGGKTAAYGTAELTFPIIQEGDTPKLRGAVFYDMGSVSGNFNSDVGIGLRLYIIPRSPIRLDYGFPVQKDKFNESSSGRFNFNIGYKF